MVGLVDDDEIAPGVRRIPSATEPLEAQEIRRCACRHERVPPHRGKRGRGYDQLAREPARDRGGNERLSHTNVVAEENSAKLIERLLCSRDRGLLVGLQRYFTDVRTWFVIAQQNPRNSGAYSRR